MDRILRLKEFLASSPDDSFVQHALGLEYIKTGEDELAKNLFTRILEKDPGYVGTYYHLAKLLERLGETENAISVYERGMRAAKTANDNHAYGELRGALEELTF